MKNYKVAVDCYITFDNIGVSATSDANAISEAKEVVSDNYAVVNKLTGDYLPFDIVIGYEPELETE